MSYKQFTEGQRYQIEALLREGFSQSYIATQIGKNKSSVSREIRRNVTKTGYGAETAHRLTMQRHLRKSKRGIPDDTRLFVEYCLSLKWSPEQISGVGDLTR